MRDAAVRGKPERASRRSTLAVLGPLRICDRRSCSGCLVAGNLAWPGVYLVDRKGVVRYRWYGELNHGRARGEPVLRAKIEELLAEKE